MSIRLTCIIKALINYKMELIKEGDFFVLVDNSGFHRVLHAEPRKITYSSKCTIDLAQVIGKPWESVFSVIDRQSGDLKEIEEPQT